MYEITVKTKIVGRPRECYVWSWRKTISV